MSAEPATVLDELGIGVIIVSYRSEADLREQFTSMPWLDDPATVVVDNSDHEDEAQAVVEAVRRTRARLIRAPGNIGFGAAVNLGSRHVPRTARWLLLLNPDAGITQPELHALAATAEERPTALVSPHILNAEGRPWFEGGSLDLAQGDARHMVGATDWLTAACLLVPRRELELIGGLSESYWLYWEDVDLSHRWQREGMGLVLSDAVAIHRVGGSQSVDGRRTKSPVYVRLHVRNRLVFARRHLPVRLRLRWLLMSSQHARRLFRRAAPLGRRARIETGWAIARGLVEGCLAMITPRRTRRSR